MLSPLLDKVTGRQGDKEQVMLYCLLVTLVSLSMKQLLHHQIRRLGIALRGGAPRSRGSPGARSARAAAAAPRARPAARAAGPARGRAASTYVDQRAGDAATAICRQHRQPAEIHMVALIAVEHAGQHLSPSSASTARSVVSFSRIFSALSLCAPEGGSIAPSYSLNAAWISATMVGMSSSVASRRADLPYSYSNHHRIENVECRIENDIVHDAFSILHSPDSQPDSQF